ncbi:hypothetical protein BDQ12DRAFT_728402 [Crucibulum laeve]|uniref:Uncharacterized protein n=1 Tax=Crucibulum laeve TaxID=68775 RepID=A0A5C3LJJ0_9AGAR|nr:hypothetical protein BDQ12DRAFT_728402 [Crucibulum laeve]
MSPPIGIVNIMFPLAIDSFVYVETFQEGEELTISVPFHNTTPFNPTPPQVSQGHIKWKLQKVNGYYTLHSYDGHPVVFSAGANTKLGVKGGRATAFEIEEYGSAESGSYVFKISGTQLALRATNEMSGPRIGARVFSDSDNKMIWTVGLAE